MTEATATKTPTANDLFTHMVKIGASDLHLGVGTPPAVRIDGKILRIPGLDALTEEQTREHARSLMNEEQSARFAKKRDLDFAYSIPGVGRFRVNAMTRRGSTALVARHIPHEIPSPAQLGLPAVCRHLATRARGLVLVTGPTGSGKTTSLAAILDFVNATHEGHILTLEDPIEFLHRAKRCIVTQRQIGDDTDTFADGLRAGLRQDPDVIMIGEMRDLETIKLAITAAETGHLVFATLHTTSAIATVDRIIDVFPPEMQQQVRMQLAGSLQGILSQCLLPRIGGGRVGAHEVLIATDAVRAQIREGKTSQILNSMQTSRNSGMKTLEEALVELVKGGLVELEEALRVANRPDAVQRAAAGQPEPSAG